MINVSRRFLKITLKKKKKDFLYQILQIPG